MKKTYIILALSFLALVSCQNKENQSSTTVETDQLADTTTTEVVQNEATASDVDTTVTDTSNVELLDKMKTSTKTVVNDPSKGKFALAETKWKLVELNGKAVTNTSTKDFYINLDSKSGKFNAFAGCNALRGSFVMKAATKLEFSKIISTKMACKDSKLEADFIKALEKVDNYMIEGKELHFHKAKGAALAKFEAAK